MQGVFLDQASLDRNDIDYGVLKQAVADWRFYEQTAAADVSGRINTAEIVISNKVVLGEEHLAAARHLRLICVAATGVNNIDLQAAQRHGIAVCNVTRYATASVAEHVFALLLALMRNLPAYDHDVKQGLWQRSDQFCLLDHPIVELAGKKLGIVGYGELGKAVADRARAFDMEVLLAARPGSAVAGDRIALADLLPQVDVLTLHCPLTPETAHLIGAAELELMKPSAVLINTARGGIVDEAALADALRDRRLAGAAVDVLSSEPPADDQPLLAADIPNLIVTPHIAWASRQARQRLVDEIAANIIAWQQGEPRNRVF